MSVVHVVLRGSLYTFPDRRTAHAFCHSWCEWRKAVDAAGTDETSMPPFQPDPMEYRAIFGGRPLIVEDVCDAEECQVMLSVDLERGLP